MASTSSYIAREVEPRKGQVGCLYYMRTDTSYNGQKGYNTNTYQGNKAAQMHSDGCTALYNCVAYMWGRINEINNEGWKYAWGGNGGDIFPNAPAKWPGTSIKLIKDARTATHNPTPQVGAIMCWRSTIGGVGHVAVCEKVNKDGSVLLSEAAYSYLYVKSPADKATGWNKRTVRPPNYASDKYYFQGFIYHPKYPLSADINYLSSINTMNTFVPGQTVANETAKYNSSTSASSNPNLQDALDAYNKKMIEQQNTVVASQAAQVKGADLLSTSTLVESPFIIAKIGDYTFGSYTKEGSLEKANSTMKVKYPNYMDSIQITKVNGTLNTYTLTMIYQIVPGKDPNLLDRIFSTVSNTREIKLSYGDWSSPSLAIYREEEAIITKVTSNIDFANSKITYTLNCTSKALKASSTVHNFPEQKNRKVSDIILDTLLVSNEYNMLDLFPGMSNRQLIEDSNLIARDDRVVHIEAKTGMDTLKYLTYLVDCMTSTTSSTSSTIKDSTYHLIIMDDVDNEFGGAYFKVVKVGTTTRTLTSTDVYEVDIGFPTSTLVTGFNINTDNSWAILYNYADEISTNNYVYSIDNNGKVYSDYVNKASVSAYYNRETEINKTWWTRMTQFPITATLSIKGLLRPAVLMNYIRINTYFYGQKHISSGLYVITKQVDTINANGYRTELSLTRIAGDDDATIDYVQNSTEDINTSTNTTTTTTTTTNNTTTNTTTTTTNNKVIAAAKTGEISQAVVAGRDTSTTKKAIEEATAAKQAEEELKKKTGNKTTKYKNAYERKDAQVAERM